MLNDSLTMFYSSPAEHWEESIPLGNGSLGACVYGKTENEVISMNSDTLWSGYPDKAVKKENSYENFIKARNLALEGKYDESEDLIEAECLGNWTQSYLPLCDINIAFNNSNLKTENYKRILDLTTAIHTISFKKGNCTFSREIFISNPDNIYVEKLSATEEKALNFKLSLSTQLKGKSFVENNTLILDGICPSDEPDNYRDFHTHEYYPEENKLQGILFRTAVKIVSDGDVSYNNDFISITDATNAYIYFATENSFNGYDKLPVLEGKEYKNKCLDILDSAVNKNYDDLKTAHINDYSELFNRVSLDLGSDNKGDIPTNERLINHNNGTKDIALYTLIFNFGRYLIITASREGTQASTLQGIWNNKLQAPWHSNYTVNINTEMNYWPVLMCNLAECNLPIIDFIKDISVAGEKTAKERYNARGFCAHHNIDLWRQTGPVAGDASWAFWPMSGGWLCEHLYNHYLYTDNIEFLKETAYPILKKCCEFYLDMLVSDNDGYLVCAPSTSPENQYYFKGKKISVSLTTTMTMAIIKELFKNTLKATEVLGINDVFTEELKQSEAKLLPFKIGSKGQLLEWYDDNEETDLHHRHKSHLYGLHPATLITPDETPELADACRKSLEIRGDNGTGWSLGWKINMWARLFDGDHALKLLDLQLRPILLDTEEYHGGGTYPNLFDAHPPFQIDGNYGCTSGIAEMFLQSREDKIILLPALPSAFKNGKVTGLKATHNITVDISWENGELKDYKLTGDKSKVKVIYKSKEI